MIVLVETLLDLSAAEALAGSLLETNLDHHFTNLPFCTPRYQPLQLVPVFDINRSYTEIVKKGENLPFFQNGVDLILSYSATLIHSTQPYNEYSLATVFKRAFNDCVEDNFNFVPFFRQTYSPDLLEWYAPYDIKNNEHSTSQIYPGKFSPLYEIIGKHIHQKHGGLGEIKKVDLDTIL